MRSVFGDYAPLVVMLYLMGLVLTILVIIGSISSDRSMISICMFTLILGLILESYRINNNIEKLAYIFISSYLFSFIAFIGGKDQITNKFNIELCIQIWPFVFIIIYSYLNATLNKLRTSIRLTEGITMLQSVSFLYWIQDKIKLDFANWFSTVCFLAILLGTVFSIYHALLNKHLSKSIRLILSIWSSILMLAFSIDNIYSTLQNDEVNTTSSTFLILNSGIQYFLLGVSAIYCMQNILLLVGFFPEKNTNYKETLKDNINVHLGRYSENQVEFSDSIFCLVYSTSIYILNYFLKVFPIHTTIWITFFTIPILLTLRNKKNYS